MRVQRQRLWEAPGLFSLCTLSTLPTIIWGSSESSQSLPSTGNPCWQFHNFTLIYPQSCGSTNTHWYCKESIFFWVCTVSPQEEMWKPMSTPTFLCPLWKFPRVRTDLWKHTQLCLLPDSLLFWSQRRRLIVSNHSSLFGRILPSLSCVFALWWMYCIFLLSEGAKCMMKSWEVRYPGTLKK